LPTDHSLRAPPVFTTPSERAARFSELCARFFPQRRGCRILDLGCGSGAQLLTLAASRPDDVCVGVDIAEGSIAAARRAAHQAGLQDRVRFEAGDYLAFRGPPFDIIISDGVLHNIPGDDGPLFAKLAADVVPGGVLLVTIPYDCAYNRALWAIRRLARLLRGRLVNRAILAVAKRLHPDWPTEMLAQRVMYMYLLPDRMDGTALRRGMAAAGLDLIEEQPVAHASLGQAKHRLLVLRRRAN
jgi:trans-aconitate 2-methyltransferase